MFTSRAEHRLHLRADNADERLTPIGRKIGLVDDDRFARFESRRAAIESARSILLQTRIDGVTLDDYLRRPTSTWADVVAKSPALA
jgi:tRNA uridine 5-carboxymethylaminomethyl modification enzyme